MKRSLFIFITMLMVSVSAMAQKGSWYLGGTVSYNSTTDKAPSPSTAKTVASYWYFAPEFGTFLKDDIQLGFALGMSGSTNKNNIMKTSSSFNFDPTVYGRKFFKITDNFSTFAGLYLSFLSDKRTTYSGTPPTTTTSESTSSGLGLKLGAGVAYALSPRFTAVGQYGFLSFASTTDKTNGTKTGTTSTFNFGANTLGPVLNIGLYYTLKTAN